MPGWMKHRLESRLQGEISITLDMQMTPSLWQKVKRNWRASWWKWKRRMKKQAKAYHSENEDHVIHFHHLMATRWGNNGNSDRLNFLGLQNPYGWWLQPSNSKMWLFRRKAMTNLDSMLKSRDITLPTKVFIAKAMVLPVVMYVCESWFIKKAECWKVDSFKLWFWVLASAVHILKLERYRED